MLIIGLGSDLEKGEFCSRVRQLKKLPKHIQKVYICLMKIPNMLFAGGYVRV